MRDFDVYELDTAEKIDAAFAKTFGLPDTLAWAQGYDQNAVTDFLEALTGKRRVFDWEIHFRNWSSGNYPYEGCVRNVHYRDGGYHSVRGYGYSEFACHALMKAAIDWDQGRRRAERERRLAAQPHAAGDVRAATDAGSSGEG